MFKSALLVAAGAAVLIAAPADARYRHYGHHYRHHYQHHFYYSYRYYSPYYSYPAYAYSYPAYYGYPAYYSYPTYYAYPYGYPTLGISIGFGGYHRHWR